MRHFDWLNGQVGSYDWSVGLAQIYALVLTGPSNLRVIANSETLNSLAIQKHGCQPTSRVGTTEGTPLTGSFSGLTPSETGYINTQIMHFAPFLLRLAGSVLSLTTFSTATAAAPFSIQIPGSGTLSLRNTFCLITVYDANGRAVSSGKLTLQGSGGSLDRLTPIGITPAQNPVQSTALANTFLGGPASGGAAPPVYRTIPADLAQITASQNTFLGGPFSGGSGALWNRKLVSTDLPAGTSVVVVDGIQYTTVQAAINALPATGGAVLIPPGTYVGPTNIPSGTALIGMSPALGVGLALNQTVLTYTSSLTLTNVSNTRWENLSLNFSTAPSAAGLELKAFNASGNAFCVQNQFTNIVISQAGGASVPALKLSASGSGATISNSFNHFDHIIIYGNASTGSNPGPAIAGIQLIGSGTPNVGPTVTQNSFNDIFIRGGLVGGIDLELNSDTNFFYKTSVLQEWASTPANSYGIGLNLNTPASDQDADACYFYGFNLTGSFTNTVRTGQATGHLIDLTGFNAPPSVAVTGGTPQFSGRIVQLNGGASSEYNFQGTKFTVIGIPTTTLKVGSQTGTNYSTTSLALSAVDATNLTYTAVVPLGWKLIVWGRGQVQIANASVQGIVALVDTSTSTTIGSADIISALNTQSAFSMMGVVTGDGNSHTIQMQFKTTNAADAFSIGNNGFGFPQMLLMLTPSN
jgi:hypothetical protein